MSGAGKNYEFRLDIEDDDDDTVRVPLRTVTTQSNDKAATLSKQLAKSSQKKRAALKRRESMLQGSDLTTVVEASQERSHSPNSSIVSNSSAPLTPIQLGQSADRVETAELPVHRLESLTEFGLLEKTLEKFGGQQSSHLEKKESHDLTDKRIESFDSEEEDDEMFYDALDAPGDQTTEPVKWESDLSDIYSPELDQCSEQFVRLSLSCPNGISQPSDSTPFQDGVSVTRAAMSQSLVRVDEEPANQQRLIGHQTLQRSPRSTSVAGRPSTSALNFSIPYMADTAKPEDKSADSSTQSSIHPLNYDSPDSATLGNKRQSRSPNHAGNASSSLGGLTATLEQCYMQSPLSKGELCSTTTAMQVNSPEATPVTAIKPHLQTTPTPQITPSAALNQTSDDQNLAEMARRQEEALKFLVRRKQESADRKSSAESNGTSQQLTSTPSPIPAVLPSDIAGTQHTPPSQIPRPARRSAIPQPSARIVPSRRTSAGSHMTNDYF